MTERSALWLKRGLAALVLLVASPVLLATVILACLGWLVAEGIPDLFKWAWRQFEASP